MVHHDNAQREYGNNTSHSYQLAYQDHLREGVGMNKGRREGEKDGVRERGMDGGRDKEREGRRGEREMEKDRMEERIIPLAIKHSCSFQLLSQLIAIRIIFCLFINHLFFLSGLLTLYQ